MKRNNKIILLVLFLLIIVTILVISNSEAKENKEKIKYENAVQETEDNTETLRYDNGNVSYFDYYKDGKLDIDIKEYVKLPENYLKNKIINRNDIESEVNSILKKIIQETQVNYPIKLLNGFLGDLYNSEKVVAELSNKNLDDYIKDTYGYETYQKYAEEFMKYSKEIIKKDLIYQALIEELNITITKKDIENFYSEKLSNGETYESIENDYGEKYMYECTVEDKIKQVLKENLS